jgi:hypothetical protein
MKLLSALLCAVLAYVNGNAQVAVSDTLFSLEDQGGFAGDVSLNDTFPEDFVPFYTVVSATGDDEVASDFWLSNSGSFSGNNMTDGNGMRKFLISVCNGLPGNACVLSELVILVEPVNDPPSIWIQSRNVCQGDTYSDDVVWASQDGEGDAIILTEFNPEYGSATFTPGGVVTLVLPDDYVGELSIEYTLCDDYSPPACTTRVVVWHVRANTFSVNVSSTPPTCEGDDNGFIQLTVSGGINRSIQWQRNGVNFNYWGSSTLVEALYTYIITDSQNCATTYTGEVYLDGPQLISAEAKTLDFNCQENTVTKEVQASGGTSPYTYLWSATEGSAQHTAARNELVEVTIRDQYGCTLVQEVLFDADECAFGNAFIPEGFSPNGDGLNDVFAVLNWRNAGVLRAVVWTPTGKVVFDGVLGDNGWDGRDSSGELVSAGTYYTEVRLEGSSEVYRGFIEIRY